MATAQKSSKDSKKAIMYADKMVAFSKKLDALIIKRNELEKRFQGAVLKQSQALKAGNVKLAQKHRAAALTYNKALQVCRTQIDRTSTTMVKLELPDAQGGFG